MAWVTVPGNPEWEYDNAATAADTYQKAPGADNIVGGVRSWTTQSGTTREVYVKCRKTSDPTATGDLDKTYYDNRN